jgi:hypothetical protein
MPNSVVNKNAAFQTGTDQALINATYSPGLPSQNTPVDVSKLGTTPTFNLPTPSAAAPYDIGTLPSITSLLNPTPTAADTKQANLETQLLADTKTLGTQGAAQITAESAAGLPGLNKQLVDINGQITSLQAEAARQSNVSEDRLAPTFAINGEQAQIERARSVKALGLSAIASTIQGNIALAQQQANKAVELQFSAVQADINYLTQALSLNKDTLSREDQKRATQLQVALQDRQRQLDQAKQDKTTILGWAAEAAKNGANSVLINQAMVATDPNQALQLLGQYLSDPVAKQQALANLALTRANINKTNAEAAVAANPASKPATQFQQTTANYASRIVQANQIIESVGGKFANASPLAYSVGSTVPSFLQTSDRQAYEQAKKNFVNAVLRQESGATIPDNEFKNAESQYFPLPGDTPSTVAQKAANRSLVSRNFINASGNAYQAPSAPAASQTYSVNGKTYVQGTDGLYYPQ